MKPNGQQSIFVDICLQPDQLDEQRIIDALKEIVDLANSATLTGPVRLRGLHFAGNASAWRLKAVRHALKRVRQWKGIKKIDVHVTTPDIYYALRAAYPGSEHGDAGETLEGP